MIPIPDLVAELDELQGWRRHLHAHPELGFEEHETSRFIAERLRDFGIDVHEGIAGTGVVGVLQGRAGTRTVGLRADMDALPIEESNGFAHRSVVAGRMHACGHDGHSVMLLAAARHLARDCDFAGTIHFIFQPAEELASGAKAMIDAGLFDRFPCDAVYALHNRPNLALGHALVNPGAMMAGAAKFEIVIEGVGGHGGRPHLAVDPVVAAAQFILAAQTIVARSVDPMESAVVTIAAISGGDAINVIPDRVQLKGTARYFDRGTMETVRRRLDEISSGVGALSGAAISATFIPIVPPTVNHSREAELARHVLVDLLGAANVTTSAKPAPGSEDFSYMLEMRPGAFIFLGMREEAEIPMIHHPAYEFNDRLLPIGASYFIEIARRQLLQAA